MNTNLKHELSSYARTQDRYGLNPIANGTKRQINAYWRAYDTSHKWPINGRFNVTERAIRRLHRTGVYTHGGLEYFLALEHTISHIVNSAV
jgi:hypothetical protein